MYWSGPQFLHLHYTNLHGLLLRLMSLMHWYTCKCLQNILGRAVEQLAGCLAKETKVSSRGQSTTVMQRRTCSLSSYEYLIRCRKATWIAVNLASPKATWIAVNLASPKLGRDDVILICCSGATAPTPLCPR